MIVHMELGNFFGELIYEESYEELPVVGVGCVGGDDVGADYSCPDVSERFASQSGAES
jgi:hypothetical protein